jgi:myosin-5
VVIQKVFRSYVLRNKRKSDFVLLNRRVELSRDNRAAVAIQRMVRGFLVRSRLKALDKAAKTVQGFWRMKCLRRYFLNIRASVTILQLYMKRFLVRQKAINEKTAKFAVENGSMTETVSQLEHDILFSNLEKFTTLKNVNDYTRLPFFQFDRHPDFGNRNYRLFVPRAKEGEFTPKVRLMTCLVDLNVHADSTAIYHSTWAFEFVSMLKSINAHGKRLLQVEIGETFTLAITEDGEVYSWGLNDCNQCARPSEYTLGLGKVKSLAPLAVRTLSAGNDHALLVDEGNNVFTWGRNSEGQLGLGHSAPVSDIKVLNMIKDPVKFAMTRENKNYALTHEGKVICWPIYRKRTNGQSKGQNGFPYIEFPMKIVISSLDVGTDFAIFLSNSGLVFGMGSNEFGQLGQGDFSEREAPTMVSSFREINEKVIEIRCGSKHVVARTSVGRVFAWGLNSEGQLGTGDRKPRYLPTKVVFGDPKLAKAYPRSVQSGLSSSFILFETKQVYYMGSIGATKNDNLKPSRFAYEGVLFSEINADDFRPVRLVTKWSRTMTATTIVFADFRYEGGRNEASTMKDRVADKIQATWSECSQQG